MAVLYRYGVKTIMNVDLHLHTIYSDGSETPEAIVHRAKNMGFDIISITDHDGIGGVEDAIREGRRIGIKVIPGIELSAEHITALPGHAENRYFMHILGYGIDIEYAPLIERLNSVLERRSFRNRQIIDEFKKKGIVITEEELMESTPNLFIGKVSFAKILLHRGYVSSVDEAFESEEFLASKAIKSIRKDKIPAREAIDLIHGAGGKVFFAHPYQLTYLERFKDDEKVYNKKLRLILTEFKFMGLDGIECGYPTHSAQERDYILGITDELGLLCSRGSDDHGPGIRAVKNMGRMQAEIPADRLDYLGKIW